MLFLPLGLFYKTMGLLDEVNYNNNNSYNLSTIILVVGWLLEDGARRPPSYLKIPSSYFEGASVYIKILVIIYY